MGQQDSLVCRLIAIGNFPHQMRGYPMQLLDSQPRRQSRRRRKQKEMKVTGIDSIQLKGREAHFTFYEETIKRGRTFRRILEPTLIVEMQNLPTCISQANGAVIAYARQQFLRAIGYNGETVH
jgi:hypothetical protein